MTSEPRLGSPTHFELDRVGAQSEASGKIRVSGFLNWIVQFLWIQPLPVSRTNDGDRDNLPHSGIWVREGKDRG
jgi:hypothetical protein